ncbi:MAG: pyruvate kinase [Armatimonadetes bacterium]|nr:pyruvate kinase [Armatimonadota bacterium]
MERRTKIVVTLGPAVDSKEKIQQLIEAGMNVARLNCSHGGWESKRQWIEWIRELSSPCAPVAILADLQGPKFRVGNLPTSGLDLVAGQKVTLGVGAQVPIDQHEILAEMAPEERLLLGDGEIEIKIDSKENEWFTGTVITGGNLKSKKGITLVGIAFKVPALTTKDVEDIKEAIDAKVDFIALSYVKHAADIKLLKWELDKLEAKVKICAKIETPEAIQDLDSIMSEVDIIMVARGDMGLQMDIEDVPRLQKRIIDRCGNVGIPVITATQMLESMMVNPRPTRAEVSDVFNAITDGTDAIMLSGETAAGQYPVECVKVMSRIAVEAEYELGDSIYLRHSQHEPENHTQAIAHAIATLERQLAPAAVLATSASGQTPRLVSKYRPKSDILCASWNRLTVAYMAVVWGVQAMQIDFHATTDDILENATDTFVKAGRLKSKDLVIFTAGVPAGKVGSTNLIMTQVINHA